MTHVPLNLADITNGQKWVLVIMAVMTILWAVARPLMRKKDPLAKKPFSSLAQQRSVERQMQNVLVELSEMTRQVSAQLDTRSAKLEVLIREADEKLAALKAATSRQVVAPAVVAPEPQSIEIDRPPLPIDPRHQEIYRLADEGRSAREIAQQLNRPSGEVELILALRGQKNDAMAG